MSHNLVLVVDAKDRPLAAMPADAVLAQGLLHRRVLAVSIQSDGRLLLRRHQGVWLPAAAGMVGAMEGAEDAVERLLHAPDAPIHLLTILPPTARLRAFLWVFVVHEETTVADAMAVDHEEMTALVDRYPDQVALELKHAWEARALLLKA
ncbi:MAG: hypothetical protein WHT64_03195 [Desulfomicrobiaceae bacterium]